MPPCIGSVRCAGEPAPPCFALPVSAALSVRKRERFSRFGASAPKPATPGMAHRAMGRTRDTLVDHSFVVILGFPKEQMLALQRQEGGIRAGRDQPAGLSGAKMGRGTLGDAGRGGRRNGRLGPGDGPDGVRSGGGRRGWRGARGLRGRTFGVRTGRCPVPGSGRCSAPGRWCAGR